MRGVLCALMATCLMGHVSAQKPYVEEEDDLLLNRAGANQATDEDSQRGGVEAPVERAASFKPVTLMARLLGAKDAHGQWHERGQVSLGYSNLGNLHSVEISTERNITEVEGTAL